ncbi:MAG: hypothetical protein IJV22_04570 [Bacteroidales bacterium]|nr:hypothetical protein [Bacteroidales bacterium]
MSTTAIAITIVATALLSIVACGYFFYLITRKYFAAEQKRLLLQMKVDERAHTLQAVTPIRLGAYERMALFLERISPESLVMRNFRPGMDTKQLQSAMTQSVRSEWEHNLSQQVYLSSECWNRIREAKDEMINLVNASASNLAIDADPTSLAGNIFSSVASSKVPTDEALEFLKDELHQLFD